jgi:hypothetical protein
LPRLWTIRSETLAALDEAAALRFARVSFAALARENPLTVQRLGEARFREEIARGIAVAARYAIDTERDVFNFLSLWFAADRSFEDTWPWAVQILTNHAVRAPTRLAMIQQLRS